MADSNDPIVMTEAGYHRLAARLEHLQNTERQRLALAVREVREDGELNENPALLDALEEQAALEHRIADLQRRLARTIIAASAPDGRAGVGSVVSVRDTETGTTLSFQLVGDGESDPDDDRISVAAPIGSSLLGRRAGDTVEVDSPRGLQRLLVMQVEDPAA